MHARAPMTLALPPGLGANEPFSAIRFLRGAKNNPENTRWNSMSLHFVKRSAGKDTDGSGNTKTKHKKSSTRIPLRSSFFPFKLVFQGGGIGDYIKSTQENDLKRYYKTRQICPI